MTTPAKRIILFPQDKGGIGKSFVATLLFDYLRDESMRVKAFDLDHANSTFQRFVQEAEFIDTDVDADKLGVLDRIVHVLPEADVVLVDNWASGGSNVLAYLDETRLPEIQADSIAHSCSASSRRTTRTRIRKSPNCSTPTASVCAGSSPAICATGSLSLFAQSLSRQTLAGPGAVEIDVPCLAEVTRNRLQEANLTVGRGRTAEQLPLLDRSRCVRFHQRMTGEFTKAAGAADPMKREEMMRRMALSPSPSPPPVPPPIPRKSKLLSRNPG